MTLVYSDVAETVVATAIDKTLPCFSDIENLPTKQKVCIDFTHRYYLQTRQVQDDPLQAGTIASEAYNYKLEDGTLQHFCSKKSRNVPVVERLIK